MHLCTNGPVVLDANGTVDVYSHSNQEANICRMIGKESGQDLQQKGDDKSDEGRKNVKT